MMMEELAGIVLAAGHGSLVPAQHQTKLIEEVRNRPMVCRPVQLLRDELKLSPTLVVTNSRFGQQIRDAIKPHPQQWLIHQPERTGTAGAVLACLPSLRQLARTSKHAVVLYGDMPCWQTSSISGLLQQHVANQATISMFRIDLRGAYGKHVQNFGRILHDESGRIMAVREPYEMTAMELAQACYVNPSAWVFDLSWLEKHLLLLKPHDKSDGFAHEYWLPDLVPVAVEQNRLVIEVDLPDAREALGINTLEELQEVRTLTTEV